MRRRQWACIGSLLGLMAMLLAATAYVCLFRSVPLRISKETTYITEPLTSDGAQVDYFAAWEQETYPENMATEENGYRLIVQHLGKRPYTESAHFAQLCEKLGLDAEMIQPDMTLEHPSSFLSAYVASEDFDESIIDRLVDHEYEEEPIRVLNRRINEPWTLDDLPMMEAWLAQNDPALDLIGEAVRKPVFHIPLTRASEEEGLILTVAFDPNSQMRSFAIALQARTNYRIAKGDIDGAIDDIITIKRLGRHFEQQRRLIPMLVGIALEGIAGATGVAGSLEHPPTTEQLGRFVEKLNNLPARAALDKVWRSERFMMLEMLQATAHGGGPLKELDLAIPMPERFGYDWNVLTERINDHYDTLLATGQYPRPTPTVRAALTLRSRSAMMADELTLIMLASSSKARNAWQKIKCTERIHRIILAMLLYECDHGTLPLAYTVDGDGNPLHSWRVVLLPYLGQQELCDKIRLDEPWDSQHNQQFHNEAISFYQCPSAKLPPGQTTYSVVVGPDMPFETGQGKVLSDFGPNSANMILVVERTLAGCWMNPLQEVPQAVAEEGINLPNRSGSGIGSQHTGGACCGNRNGAVQFLSESINLRYLADLLQGTGG